MGYLAQYKNTSTGLLDLPPGPWWQTALIDWYGPESSYGQSTALNAMYYGTLLDAADVADGVGDSVRARDWRQTAGTLKDQINKYLYRPAEGQYISSIFKGEARARTLHAQAWALAYDVVPEDEQQRVADGLLALISPDPESPNVGIYGMFWVLEGLGRAGRISEAISIIKTYYGYMLNHGATTWWEGFGSNRSYTESLSHGWGTAPTWFLTTYALGARRSGSNTWLVHLALDALPSVAGALPLRTGALQLRWDNRRCGTSTLQLVAPADSSGVVLISDTAALALTLDGVLIWKNSLPLSEKVNKQPDGLRLKLNSGPHRLDMERTCTTGNYPFTAR
jgi:alpha-L-rhamnosidase